MDRLSRVAQRIAGIRTAQMMWKYADDEGKVFFLTERVTGTLRSPFTGKSFRAQPEKLSMSGVKDEIEAAEEAKKAEKAGDPVAEGTRAGASGRDGRL